MAELTSAEVSSMRELAKDDMYFLGRGVLGFEQMTPQFHGPLCKFLQYKGVRNKLVCLPRGFFKTTLATKTSAISDTLNDPWCSNLIACQKHDNAAQILNDIRSLWQTRTMLHVLFPELVPNFSTNWSSEKACINRPPGGFLQQEMTYESAGIGTQLQSRHYDNIHADDIVVAKKDQTTGMWMQPSEEDIQKAIGWHQMTWGIKRTPATTAYTQVMTRWCPDDMFDYLCKEEGVDSSNTPTMSLIRKSYGGRAPVEGKWAVYLRAAVEEELATFGEKYSLEVLAEIASDQGAYKYSTQYLCLPVANENLVFANTYELYALDEKLPKFKRIVAACDPAIGQKKSNHPTAIGVVGVEETGERWVLDVVADRMSPTEVVDAIFDLWAVWRFREVAIETVAYQEALVYYVKERFKKTGNVFRIIEIRPGTGDKKSLRIEAMEPSFTAGWWKIRADMAMVRDQLDLYPFGLFDDILDMLAMVHRLLPPIKGRREKQTATEQINTLVVTYEDIIHSLEEKTRRQRQAAGPYDVQLAHRAPANRTGVEDFIETGMLVP